MRFILELPNGALLRCNSAGEAERIAKLYLVLADREGVQ